MDSRRVFCSKAEKYARYRWDYAPAAIQAILETSQIGPQSVVADIGAGTGILTKHLIGKAGHVYAIEPNHEMRAYAEKAFAGLPSCTVIDASAEASTLPPGSIDLITVAQAIHWFEPEAARREFTRLLKPGGWLAILRNYGVDGEIGQAMDALFSAENGFVDVRPVRTPEQKAMRFFFASEDFQLLTFYFTLREDWETFFGGLLSASSAPDEQHPLFRNLESAARDVFERFSRDGWLESLCATELVIGQPVNSVNSG